eukprot:10496-Heterococcus_DN1.PRE.1
MRLVTERLHDYRKLSDVISEHGALGNAVSVMVLRLWCKQLLTLLADLHSHSLLLRDMSASSILLSPTGHTLKVASIYNMSMLGVDGRVKPGTTVDMLTSDSNTVLLPPESVDNKQQQPTTSLNVWLFGAVLHVLAFGTAPPIYSTNNTDSASSCRKYDVLSAMHSVNSSSAASNMQAQTPLAQALLSGSFGAIMNIGSERTSSSENTNDTANNASHASSLKRQWLHAQLQQHAESEIAVPSYTDTAVAVYKQCPQLCDMKCEHLSTLMASWSTSEHDDSVTLQQPPDAVEITQLLRDKLRLTLIEACVDRLLQCVQATHNSGTAIHDEQSNSVTTTAISIYTALAEALIELANAGKQQSATQHIDLGSSLLDILVLCLSRERPTVHQLLAHPFFANVTGDNESIAIRAAAAYMTSGTNVTATLQHSVQRPLDALLPQLMHADTAVTDIVTTVDVSLLTTALRAVSTLLHWVPTGSYGKHSSTMNASSNKLSALQHTDAVDAVMSQQLLPKLTALALRFLQCEEAESMLHQQHDTATAAKKQSSITAAVHHPVGMRVVLVLTRILEGLILELQHSHSPVVHYVDVVLKCLTALYIGQEGCLSNVYGVIGKSPLVTSQQQQYIPEDTDRWCKELSDIAFTVLVEAVSETGSGNALYPAVTEYIARCSEFKYSANSHDTLDDSSALTSLTTYKQHRTARAQQQGVQHDATTAAMLNENSGGNGIGLIRQSNIVPYFVRGAVYYEELLSLGKALSQILTATSRSVALRAR